MRLTIIITALLTLIVLSLNLGGCQSRYRYPCQDPSNWGKSECHNDACKAEGTCTTDTLGNRTDINTTESEPDPDPDAPPQEEPAEKKTEEVTNPVISSNTVSECKPPEKKVNFGAKRAQPPPPLYIQKQVEGEQAVVEGEQPVTMDTVVTTTEHNEAAR
jgi:hypothetical protein